MPGIHTLIVAHFQVGGRTNDLMLLDLSSWQWSQPALAGTAPSPRYRVNCAKEVGTKEHTHACPHPSPPAPPLTPPHPTVPSLPHFPCRQASAICVGHGNLLFVSSGRNNFVLEDLNVLDFMVGVDTQVCRAHKCGIRGWETEWLLPCPPSEQDVD